MAEMGVNTLTIGRNAMSTRIPSLAAMGKYRLGRGGAKRALHANILPMAPPEGSLWLYHRAAVSPIMGQRWTLPQGSKKALS